MPRTSALPTAGCCHDCRASNRRSPARTSRYFPWIATAREMTSADLSIRFGPFAALRDNEWPLIRESVSPVCSPACRERFGLQDILGADDLHKTSLLHMDEREPRWMNWHEWCEHAGIETPVRTTRFNHNNYPLLLSAAAEGRGLAAWVGPA